MSIGFGAFDYCKSLTSIIIPSNISFIENSAFEGCTNLKSITFKDNNNNITIGPNIFKSTAPSAEIYIPGKFFAKTTYKSELPPKSHLYITSQTRLSESCKIFFGEKSIYVHYNDKVEITDDTTNQVIKHISLAIIVPKSVKKARSRYFHLYNIFISIRK